jgi:hypothetical protein
MWSGTGIKMEVVRDLNKDDVIQNLNKDEVARDLNKDGGGPGPE